VISALKGRCPRPLDERGILFLSGSVLLPTARIVLHCPVLVKRISRNTRKALPCPERISVLWPVNATAHLPFLGDLAYTCACDGDNLFFDTRWGIFFIVMLQMIFLGCSNVIDRRYIFVCTPGQEIKVKSIHDFLGSNPARGNIVVCFKVDQGVHVIRCLCYNTLSPGES
jgi:hypothetical protein